MSSGCAIYDVLLPSAMKLRAEPLPPSGIPLGLPLRCGIALGSNIGDRMAHLRNARAAIERLHTGPEVPLVSAVYETEPVDCEPNAGAYLNAVMEIEFAEPPTALLGALQQIENALGRPSPRARNAPRTIDLDLLYADCLTLANDKIVLPHPRLRSRRFVLQPLADIRPNLILPGCGEPISALLSKLPERPSVTRIFPAWHDIVT